MSEEPKIVSFIEALAQEWTRKEYIKLLDEVKNELKVKILVENSDGLKLGLSSYDWELIDCKEKKLNERDEETEQVTEEKFHICVFKKRSPELVVAER